MNLFVNQTITIYQLKVQGIQNSSVLQIGSAGMIRPVSNLYNTGGFTGEAPPLAAAPTVELPAPS
ncbi:spore germination protein GerPB [Fictibacillus sp. KIGAM418]|uniref:Spore germination protein GerPB n=1 Tax=Fictibacillus marinisediminis TaxID=2878389 RepID=A0A9X2BE37_9BACL|nr:spore germination protein GerPB [Fictibacillus marinisediminis]MCK6255702.1 spore germination protein GerPB [Fictibacillus marinisediminis]